MSQPATTNSKGVILTIGLRVNGERCAIVLPMGTESTLLDATNLCKDVVTSSLSHVGPLLLACITTDAYMSFQQGEGMIDGMVPYREDYDPTDWPGTRTPPALPTNTGPILYFYEDPVDNPTHLRIRVGKNTIPGWSAADTVGDKVNSIAAADLDALATILHGGFASTLDPSGKWYRYLATPKPRTPATPLKRVSNWGTRLYLATQRRRFIPRG